MPEFGRVFILIGIILVIVGVLFNLIPNFPRLPGDIYIDRQGVKIYIPITTSILISVILTLILNLLRK